MQNDSSGFVDPYAENEEDEAGLSDYALDIPRGIASGVVGFGQSIGDIADKGVELLGGDLFDDETLTEEALPDWMRTKTWVGGLTSGLTQAAVGFIPVAGAVGWAGRAAKAGSLASRLLKAEGLAAGFSRGLVQGAVVDAVAFRGDQGRLSDLLVQLGGVGDNAMTRYLATDEEDSWLEGRAKNAIEGLMLGGVADALVIPGLRAVFGKDPYGLLKHTSGHTTNLGADMDFLLQSPKEAAERGLITPELAEKLGKVDWEDPLYRLDGEARTQFADQLRGALSGTKDGDKIAAANLALSDAFAKTAAVAEGTSVDEQYTKMFAGARGGGDVGSDALFQVNPTAKLMSGEETLDVKGTGRGNAKITIEDVATALEKRQRILKRAKADDYSPASMNELADDLKIEAATALDSPESVKAIGWYSEQVRQAMGKLSAVYPELADDPKSDFVFKMLLAVTSNGTDPKLNLRSASNLYEQWKATGNFVGKGLGTRGSSIEKSLAKVKTLVDQMGGDDAAYLSLRDLFNSDMTAKELKKLTGNAVPKESSTAALKGSMMLGPKIGAFFQNLYGNFSYPTLDSWMYRQYNRIRGNLTVSKADLDVGRGRSMVALKKLVEDTPGLDLEGLNLEKAAKSSKYFDDFAAQIEARLSQRDFKNPTPLESWAKGHVNRLSPLYETPRGGEEQGFFRSAMQKAAADISRERGVELTVADLQAILWYHEKGLYEKLGIKGKSAARVDYSSAADEFVAARRGAGPRGRDLAGSADTGAAGEAAGAVSSAPDPALVLNQRPAPRDTKGQLPLSFLAEGPRGAVQFAADGRALVTLFKSADASTVVHEMGHIFRRNLSRVSQSLLDRSEKALGVSFSTKDPVALRAAEEAWAEHFEKYISTGKAPTAELKSVFKQFKSWMTDVYRGIIGSPLEKEVPAELRDVFDTMLGKGWNRANVSAKKPTSRGINTPSVRVRGIRDEYLKSIGREHTPQRYADIHEPTSRAVADAFEAAKHDPTNPEVISAYKALVDETKAQWDVMQKSGVRVVFTDADGYASSQAMAEDLEKNGRLLVFKTFGDSPSDMPKDHPLAAEAGFTVKDAKGKEFKPTWNDVFRAVHDHFGHAAEGYQFGPRGGENAWIQHSKMYSPEARRALTAETRGQNAWVNYGPTMRRSDSTLIRQGDADFIPAAKRPFAQQKATLLPEWASWHEELGDVQKMASRFGEDYNEAVKRGIPEDASMLESMRTTINHRRVSTTEDARIVLEATASQSEEAFHAGRLSMQQMQKLVEDTDLTVDQLQAHLRKAPDEARRTIAALGNAKTHMIRSAEEVAEVASRAQQMMSQTGGEISEALYKEMTDAVLGHQTWVGLWRDAARAQGQAVKSMDLVGTANGPIEKAAVSRFRSVSEAVDGGSSDDLASEVLQDMAKTEAAKGKQEVSSLLEALAVTTDQSGRVRARGRISSGNADFLRGGGEDVGDSFDATRTPVGPPAPKKKTEKMVSPEGTNIDEGQDWAQGAGENVGTMRDSRPPRAPADTSGVMRDGDGYTNAAEVQREAGIGKTIKVTPATRKFIEGIVAANQTGQANRQLKSMVNAHKAGLLDVALEYQKAMILSGIPTFAVNGGSGGVMTFLNPLLRATGAALSGNKQEMVESFGLAVKVVGAFRDVIGMSWTAPAAGNGTQGPRGLRTALGAVRNDKAGLYAATGGETRAAIRAETFGASDASMLGKGINAAGHVIRIPFKINQFVDEVVGQVNYLAYVRQKAASVAHRTIGADKTLTDAVRSAKIGEFIDEYTRRSFDDMGAATKGLLGDFSHQDAVRYAQSATFSQDLLYGVGKSVQDLKGKHPLLDLVIPFVKAPTNILRMAGQMTPGVNVLMDRARTKAGVALTRDEQLRNRGMLAMGTALWGYATYLSASGQVTGGGPVNRQERDALRATGWQPYSLVFTKDDGSKEYVEFKRLDPFSNIMGIAADFADAGAYLQDGEKDQVATLALTSLANNITSRSYLSGLSEFLKALTNPAQNAGSFARGRVGALVPTFFARAASAEDDSLREVRTVLDAVRNRLPFAREGLAPRRNALGEVITPQAGYIPFVGDGGALGQIASPTAYSKSVDNNVLQELSQLGHIIGKPGGTINGIDLTLWKNNAGQDAYDRYQELAGTVRRGGKTLSESLSDTINSRAYQSLNRARRGDATDPRAQMVSKVFAAYRRDAQKQMLSEFPQLKQQVESLKSGGPASADPSPVMRIIMQR